MTIRWFAVYGGSNALDLLLLVDLELRVVQTKQDRQERRDDTPGVRLDRAAGVNMVNLADSIAQEDGALIGYLET